MLLPPALKAGPADATVGRDGFPDCRDDLIEGLGFDPVKDEGLQLIVALNLGRCTGQGLCCTNPVRDSSCESSVVAVLHEQTHTPRLQDQELARL